jgi:macrolide transport system ATP-binding/permease protein
MRKLRALWMRLRGLFHARHGNGEFEAELESHIDLHIEDAIRAGLNPLDARRQALIRLGGVEQTRQAYRERRGLPWLETLFQDVRFGLLMLSKSPAYTVVAVLTLAVGIGATSTVFTVANAALLRSWPAKSPEQLVEIIGTMPHGRDYTFSYPDYEDMAGQSRSFEGIIAYSRHGKIIQQGPESQFIADEIVTSNYFSILGIDADLDRAFTAASRAGGEKAVVISDSLWRRVFSADPALVGKQISLNGSNYAVIGIAPRGFRGLTPFVPADLWLPVATELPSETSDRKLRDFQLLARLRPGATAEQARVELDTLGRRLAQAYPAIDKARTIGMISERERLRKAMVPTVMLLAIVGLVLLICCANVAGLILARADARRKEIAVRLALGATRLRLIRQLLTESLLLATLGAGFGLLLAVGLFRLQPALLPPERVALGFNLHLDVSVVAFTIALTVLAVLVFGFVPALQATKVSSASELKGEEHRIGRTARRWTVRNALVVGEIALSAMLLTASGLVVRSLLSSRAIDLGFDNHKHLVFLDLLPDIAGYNTTRSTSFFQQLETRAAALPGVKHTALAQRVLLTGSGGGATKRVSIPGLGLPQGQQNIPIMFNTVDSNYFQTMGTRLLEGREFTSADNASAGNVVVISRAMANSFWPGKPALGQQIVVEGKTCEVIGVMEDAKIIHIHETPAPYMYFSLAQRPSSEVTLILEIEGDTRPLAEMMRSEVQRLDSKVPFEVHTAHELMQQAFWSDQMAAGFVGTLGVLAISLGAIGLYGVIAFVVNRRRQEIGIRIALGAERRDILGMVVSQGLALAAIGAGIGLVASLLVMRLLSSMLYGVKPTDPLSYAGSAALVILVALAASWIPARRAASIDPMQALRTE